MSRGALESPLTAPDPSEIRRALLAAERPVKYTLALPGFHASPEGAARAPARACRDRGVRIPGRDYAPTIGGRHVERGSDRPRMPSWRRERVTGRLPMQERELQPPVSLAPRDSRSPDHARCRRRLRRGLGTRPL